MRVHALLWPAVLLAAAGILIAATADTLPRYSAQYEQNCNLCHVGPTGGGQRTIYATKFIVPKELTLGGAGAESPTAFEPKLNDTVFLGADFRTLFFETEETGEGGSGPDNFFQMQGSLYFNLELSPRYLLNFQVGTRQTPEELFGLGYILPANGYLKVGQFQPAFGWRYDDHTRFVRANLGWNPPVTEVGVEAGVYPDRGRFAFHAAVQNGSGASRDIDENLQLVFRGVRRFRAGGVAAALGGSFVHNRRAFPGRTNAGGPLWYLKIGDVIWMGELVVSGVRLQEETTTSWFTTNELTVTPTPGLELVGVLDHFQPDEGAGEGERTRLGFGAEVRPIPFLKLAGLLNVNLVNEGRNYNQLILQVHFLN